MLKSKKKILLKVKIKLQNSQKMTENVKCSLSFLLVNKIFFLSSKTVLNSPKPFLRCFSLEREPAYPAGEAESRMPHAVIQSGVEKALLIVFPPPRGILPGRGDQDGI